VSDQPGGGGLAVGAGDRRDGNAGPDGARTSAGRRGSDAHRLLRDAVRDVAAGQRVDAGGDAFGHGYRTVVPSPREGDHDLVALGPWPHPQPEPGGA
jgi:hypothetical protein